MKAQLFIKPDLIMYFAQMPFIGQYMKYDYESANGFSQLIALCHKWNNEAEISKNPVRKLNFEAGANYLYTLITGKSYDSKEIELFTEKYQN